MLVRSAEILDGTGDCVPLEGLFLAISLASKGGRRWSKLIASSFCREANLVWLSCLTLAWTSLISTLIERPLYSKVIKGRLANKKSHCCKHKVMTKAHLFWIIFSLVFVSAKYSLCGAIVHSHSRRHKAIQGGGKERGVGSLIKVSLTIVNSTIPPCRIIRQSLGSIPKDRVVKSWVPSLARWKCFLGFTLYTQCSLEWVRMFSLTGMIPAMKQSEVRRRLKKERGLLKGQVNL